MHTRHPVHWFVRFPTYALALYAVIVTLRFVFDVLRRLSESPPANIAGSGMPFEDPFVTGSLLCCAFMFVGLSVLVFSRKPLRIPKLAFGSVSAALALTVLHAWYGLLSGGTADFWPDVSPFGHLFRMLATIVLIAGAIVGSAAIFTDDMDEAVPGA